MVMAGLDIGGTEVAGITQQDGQAAYRIRSELVQQRTAKANQIRGLDGEYGLVVPIRPMTPTGAMS